MSLRSLRARLLRRLLRRLHRLRPSAPPAVDEIVQVHPHPPQRDLRAALQRFPRLRRQFLPRDDFKRNRPVVILFLVIKRRAARRGVDIESTVALPRFLFVSLPRPRHAPSRGHRAATRFDATDGRTAGRRFDFKVWFGASGWSETRAPRVGRESASRAREGNFYRRRARASRSTRATVAPRPRARRAVVVEPNATTIV